MLKVRCDALGVKSAVETIKHGGIVIFPTDTIYGIGCSPYVSKSVAKIYDIKSRDMKKPFPILVHSIQVAQEIGYFDKTALKLAEKFWPGALTIILEVKDQEIKRSLKLEDKIALRVPNNRCILEILAGCKSLVGTSANLSGSKSVTDPNLCSIAKRCDVFVDGGITGGGKESTIIEIDAGAVKIVREGAISRDEVSDR